MGQVHGGQVRGGQVPDGSDDEGIDLQGSDAEGSNFQDEVPLTDDVLDGSDPTFTLEQLDSCYREFVAGNQGEEIFTSQ